MEEARIRYLVLGYMQEALTAAERSEFLAYTEKEEGSAVLSSVLEEMLRDAKPAADFNHEPFQEVWQKIVAMDKGLPERAKANIRTLRWPRLVAAASVILLLAAGVLIWRNGDRQLVSVIPKPVLKAENNDAAPGSRKATLTLADGTRMVLDSIANGNAAKQGDVTVVKRDGLVAYKGESGPGERLYYNTITVPRAGLYQLVLADGSKVWLNAESSLRFPVSFSGKDRRVELMGEGYFEVAKNREKPFHVMVSGMDVEVLGTHFNINAYGDEPAIKTTLLEGSVKVSRPSIQPVELKPGQQASLSLQSGAPQIEVRTDVAIDEVMAWKNGNFKFNQTDITTMMRQAQRWYDITVTYPDGVPSDKFSGTISRDVNLSQFLKILDYSDVHAGIAGKTVTIKP